MNPKLAGWIAGVSLVFLAGLGTGWRLWGPKPKVPETYARQETQKDGSTVLERKPQADAKPAQQVPKGGKVERIIQVVVDPNPPSVPNLPAQDPGLGQPPQGEATRPPCPPVRVDLTLVRLGDGSQRVVVSSPDGRVSGGVDIPVAPIATPRPLVWAAGGLYGPKDKSFGAFLDRDLAFGRVGAEIIRTPATLGAAANWTGFVKLGIRF